MGYYFVEKCQKAQKMTNENTCISENRGIN